MIQSIYSPKCFETLNRAKTTTTKEVKVNSQTVTIKTPLPSPEDWRDQIIYFIMIDRFNNIDQPPKGKWDDLSEEFKGGTFKGITQKLDYIKFLGATAIWITPPFKNCYYDSHTYHGYGIQDFLTIDERFGTDTDLIELIDQAHARGIYIILDIVLNHVGNVFQYDFGNGNAVNEAGWNNTPYNILWMDENGKAKWPTVPKDNCGSNDCIWPTELQDNKYYRRQGRSDKDKIGEDKGDFCALKELVTEFNDNSYYPVRDILIKAYQYIIAKYDCDSFRIDTLKHIEREFARTFGNAIREYALSIGKKNFFSFGEIADGDEGKVNQFIGRNTNEDDGIVGVDAALDFPLFYKLRYVVKGYNAPRQIAEIYQIRKQFEKENVSSHGEAGKYFVTFLENHDQHERFYQDQTQYNEQIALGFGALFTLQGVPCLYYGTEQGLHGKGETDAAVREALWGKPNAFDENHKFYKTIQALADIRQREPALRYGRQYFRQISADGTDFRISDTPKGVLSYSRILNNDEILVLINTNTENSWIGKVIIDYPLNAYKKELKVIYSNYEPTSKEAPIELFKNTSTTHISNEKTWGDVRAVNVELKPMEIQILKG